MKRILLLAALVVAGTALVCGVYAVYLEMAPSSPGSPGTGAVCPPLKLPPLPDVDALAARVPFDQDVYRQTRDEALAHYAKLHPGSHPYDEEARAELRLIAYLVVWDDFYGEDLWKQVSRHADNLLREQCHDPSWQVFYDVNIFQDRYANDQDGADRLSREMIAYDATGYPALLRITACKIGLTNLVSAKYSKQSHTASDFSALEKLAPLAVADYGQLISTHLPHSFLFVIGSELLDETEDDEPTLKTLSEGIDRSFENIDRYNPTADVLDGVFYTKDAWNARGSGWANTVTPLGWQLFGERLNHANDILNQVEAKSPGEWMTARAMMTVVLGLQEPRDQMEAWFQRGIKAEPNRFSLYMQKRWYLLPRWYGSDEDELAFGLECAKSDNWAAKIPVMLAECLTDAAANDPSSYARADVWPPLEKVFREFLRRYPNSIHYRSMFAKSAAQGGHWNVAREQFQLLGNNSDPDVLSPDEFSQMEKEAQAQGH